MNMPGGKPYSYSSNTTSPVQKSKYKGPSYTGKKIESSDGGGKRPANYKVGGSGSGGATHSAYPTKGTGMTAKASGGMQKQMKKSKPARRESRHPGQKY
jgi:hypothetical protein